MSKRLAYLEKITSEGSTDPFHWYCLAQEYRTLERYDDALKTFVALAQRNPDYVPMYLMCGQMLEKMERYMDAKSFLSKGIETAKKKGDSHALGELESALELVNNSLQS
jgi:tetratricopeptide (TPR) repeat protein